VLGEPTCINTHFAEIGQTIGEEGPSKELPLMAATRERLSSWLPGSRTS